MTTYKTMAWIAGLLLVVSLAGCDQGQDPTTYDEDLKAQVELTPVQDLAVEGEVLSFTVKNGHGEETIHEYVVHNGALEPIGDAPPMNLPDSHDVGVIPVSINGSGATLSQPTAKDRGQVASTGGTWAPSHLESGVPELSVDSSFRVATDEFVRQLQLKGRNVSGTLLPTTGPTRATELTRLEIDGLVEAEVYQFDSPQNLDEWYRVAYQLHESVGHDPEARIRINGMTMLRLGDNADEEIVQAFLIAERTSLQNR
jgi:hypothetical protein